MYEINSYQDLENIYKKYDGHASIFGVGKLGRGKPYLLLKLAGFIIDYYFDNNISEHTIINDIKVGELDYLYNHSDSMFVFVCVINGRNDILSQLEEQGITNYAVVDYGIIWKVLDSIDCAEDITKHQYGELFDDELYIKSEFLLRMGYEPNLLSPKTFNEKLQIIKLKDRNPRYTTMVDKYAVKEYVSSIIGKEHVIPSIGVWDNYADIDFDKLPDRFVIKCTHDSGSVSICRDKNHFDYEGTKKKLTEALGFNYFWQSREWPYKDVPPRLLVEEYVEDAENSNLPVYKIFCFSGKPVILQAIQNDKTDYETIDYYDTSWNRLDIRQNFPNSKQYLSKPQCFEEMVGMASELSKGIPFVRVDFYALDKRVLFSEFTFFSDSGFERFYPDEIDIKLGDLIDLSRL